MVSFHLWLLSMPALSPNLAILTELSNIHAFSFSANAAKGTSMGNRLVSLFEWMLLINNSSWNQSGRGKDPSYSDQTFRITMIAEEGMIGTTHHIGFRSDLHPLQWDNLVCDRDAQYESYRHTLRFNFNISFRFNVTKMSETLLTEISPCLYVDHHHNCVIIA